MTKQTSKQPKQNNKSKEATMMDILVNDGSHLALANFFKIQQGDMYFIPDRDTYMKWDSKTNLWEKVTDSTLFMDMQNFLIRRLIKHEHDNCDADDTKGIRKVNKVVANLSKLQFMNAVRTTFEEAKIADAVEHPRRFDTETDTFHFLNGYIDLRTGEFKPRTKQHYISKYAHYNYSKEVNQQLLSEIEKIMATLFNDNADIIRHEKEWTGYCLTGSTNEKRFKNYIGETSNNAKSTFCNMIEQIMGDYAQKVNPKIFSERSSQMRHKHIGKMAAPTRFIQVEELPRDRLDADFIKTFADIDPEWEDDQLYKQNTVKYKITAKLVFKSNHTPQLASDEGIGNRGVLTRMSVIFCRDEQMEEEMRAKYPDARIEKARTEYIQSITQNVDFNNTFFNIMLPYAIQYYKTGKVFYPKQVTDDFKEVNQDNDLFLDFINTYYVITKNNDDRVCKHRMLNYYKDFTKTNFSTFSKLSSEIRRIGLTYKKSLHLSRSKKQGVVLGLRERTAADDDDDDEEKKESPLDYGTQLQKTVAKDGPNESPKSTKEETIVVRPKKTLKKKPTKAPPKSPEPPTDASDDDAEVNAQVLHAFNDL